tara:strand:- start:261 stop:584 length:324 start_codon:yes stop_codon:yes gene_type:complete
MYNIIGEYMSIIELGNGSVLKDGVVFETEAKKYCTEINKDENGKVISKTFKHCEGPLYPEMTAEDHAEEQAMEQASLDYDIAQDINTEDLMEYYRDCDRLDEIEACI